MDEEQSRVLMEEVLSVKAISLAKSQESARSLQQRVLDSLVIHCSSGQLKVHFMK